jgi:hypothetical protein
MEDVLNAFVLFANFVLIPAIAYGAQLALGALGVTLIYGMLRFSNFAHGDLMAFGTMVVILFTWWLQAQGRRPRAAADRAAGAAGRHRSPRCPRARGPTAGSTASTASKRSGPGDLRDRLGRRDVHLQRHRALRDRHRRPALRGRRAVPHPRRRLPRMDRARGGAGAAHQPGADWW